MRAKIVLASLAVFAVGTLPVFAATTPYHPKPHKVKKHKRVKHT